MLKLWRIIKFFCWDAQVINEMSTFVVYGEMSQEQWLAEWDKAFAKLGK